MSRGSGELRRRVAGAGLAALAFCSPQAGRAQAPAQRPPAAEAAEDDEEVSGSQEPPPGVEEIVVVGQVQATPSLKDTESVVLYDAADIQALGAQDISDLSAYTPNVEIPTVGSTIPTFFIRGIGLADYNANSTGAISIYRDGVSINSAPIQLGLLYDVEQVQIQKGPQGIGPYRNASAGSINMISKRPTGDYSADLVSTFGHFDERDFQGHVEAPLVDDLLAGRLAFRLRERDGYMTNGCGFEPADGRQPVRSPVTSIPNQRRASVCGENMTPAWIPPGTVSKLPFGLDTTLNDTGSWGARGQFLATPDLDFADTQFLLNLHGGYIEELSTVGAALGTGENSLGGPANRNYLEREVEDFTRVTQATIRLQNPTLSNREINQRTQDAVAAELAKHMDSDPYRIDVNRVGATTLENFGGFFEAKLGRGDVQLMSRTGYETYDRYRNADQDYTPIVLFETISKDDAFQVTQDLNLSGSYELASGGLSWNLGSLYLYEELDAAVVNFITESHDPTINRIYSQKTETLAVYGDVEFRLFDDWTLAGGARWNQERKDFAFTLFNTRADGTEQGGSRLSRAPDALWSAPTGMVSLTYRFTDDASLYWKYTRGWKSGHFNASSNRLSPENVPPGAQATFNARPETIDSFETGLKFSLFDGRLTADSALFFYRYKDYQILLLKQDFSPTGVPNLEFINADGAKVLGAEFSLGAHPLVDLVPDPFAGLHFYLNFGWLDGKFTDFADSTLRVIGDPQGAQINVLVVDDYTGNTLPNAPPYTVTIGADWPIELGRFGTLTPRYDGTWSDRVYFDQTEGVGFGDVFGTTFLPEDALSQPPNWLHNFRLAYQTPDGSFEIAGWVRNMLDDVYKINSFDASNNVGAVLVILGEPRTFGLDFIVRW